MNEVKKCPKCGGDMKPEDFRHLRLYQKWIGVFIVTAYVCSNCRYVEFYEE